MVERESERADDIDKDQIDSRNSESDGQQTISRRAVVVDEKYGEASQVMTPEAEALLNRYASSERYFSGLSLVRAVLRGVNLSGADLAKCDLTGADLSYSDLSNSNLGGARLWAANLSYAKLVHTKPKLADLSSANLSFAVIESANLSGANLRGANLRGTSLYNEQQAKHEYSPDVPLNRVRASNVITPLDYMEDWWSRDPDDR
jgi:uncharacterized protein YjbI with pentapeptide repeats